jgi:hypothetical protein
MQVYDGAAGTKGTQYRILSNTACVLSGVTVLQLEYPLQTAILTSDTLSLVPSPWNGVLQSASLAQGFAGIPPRAITSGYYFWLQTGGLACGLNGGGTALGSIMVPSATEGAFKTMAAYDSFCCGYCTHFAGIDTKNSSIMLTQF